MEAGIGTCDDTAIMIPAVSTAGDSVISIGREAFFNASAIESVNVLGSVTNILDEAFYGCTSLTSITYTGTKAQWTALSKASNWNYNTGEYTIHCTDGDIPKA